MSNMLENPEAYFKKFVHPRNELLAALETEAEREEIPIVGPLAGELLSILARVTRATSILELGTATGYSAIYLARECEASNGRVITLAFTGARWPVPGGPSLKRFGFNL